MIHEGIVYKRRELICLVSPFVLEIRLLHWVQSKLPDLPIANFTTDWNDGRAVGALVDAVAPGKKHFFPVFKPKFCILWSCHFYERKHDYIAYLEML